jgi:DNA-binding CsgD family transcriptional regulator
MICDKCGGRVIIDSGRTVCINCGKEVPKVPQSVPLAIPAGISEIVSRSFSLSDREMEVFKLRLGGLRADDIADRLDISTSTVKYSFVKIRRKIESLSLIF